MYPDWQRARVEHDDLKKWRSSFVATSHALVVGFISTYFVVQFAAEKMFEGNRVYLPFGDGAIPTISVAISNGYMMYDLISMIRLGLFIHPIQAARIHHVVVISCFSTALHHDEVATDGIVFAPVLTLCLVCELTNTFLGAHKIIRWAGVDVAKSTLAIAIDALFVVFFFFTRTLLHTFVLFKTWEYSEIVPRYAFFMSFIGMILICLLDYVLLYDFATSRIKIYLPKLDSSKSKKIQ